MTKETIHMIHTQNLFQEFDPVTTEAWTHAIEKFLKGKPLESLDWELEEGVIISPLQRAENTTAHHMIGSELPSNNHWNICEKITVNTTSDQDYQTANQLLLHGLNKGANALVIHLEKLPSVAQLKSLLQGVLLDLIHIHFEGSALQNAPIDFLNNLQELPSIKSLQGSCNFGTIDSDTLIKGLNLCATAIPQLRLITISIPTTSSHALSQALHQASLWIDILLEQELSLEQIINSLRLEFNVNNHYFVELAHIRAFKKLWLGLLEAYKAPEAVFPFLHANTLSDQDDNQYWNMITATTQAMAAAIGGVDSIYVCPCNSETDANDFTRRIARNVQHLLQSESYLNRVVDPAAGSYYIEHVTSLLVQKSWQQFCKL